MDKDLSPIYRAARRQAKRDILTRLVYLTLQTFVIEQEPFIIRNSPYEEFEGVGVKISPYMLSRDVIEAIMDLNQAYEKEICALDSSELRSRAVDIVQDYLVDRLLNA